MLRAQRLARCSLCLVTLLVFVGIAIRRQLQPRDVARKVGDADEPQRTLFAQHDRIPSLPGWGAVDFGLFGGCVCQFRMVSRPLRCVHKATMTMRT